MRIPRDLSAKDLIKILSKHGYQITRQKGSHIRLTKLSVNGEHHLTIPNHDPIKLGTLNAILSNAAEHLNISKEELLKAL